MRQTADSVQVGARVRPAYGRSMATAVPRAGDRALALAVNVAFWGSVALYVAFFSAVSLQQYHAYLSHALDLGNMTQTFWNTVHGHPFHFLNMRQNLGIEAFGTNTRLSFHVEPLIPVLAIIYAFYQHVDTLLVMQTVGIATGAIPARLLARRRLGAGLPELVFPLAYLLFPAIEAANLYEFHPVAFAAPLLLWAFYFADGKRYTLFALSALAAMGCKEELGFLVALMGIWIVWRNGERQFGLMVFVLGTLWSLLAALVIVPHFAAHDSSYWGRYVPPGYLQGIVTQKDVRMFWLHHPSWVWDNLTSEAKLSYLHRIFYPAGYLALFSPITLLAVLPSLALILLSYEPHMYGGLAHYSAELVPVVVVGAILGTEWLSTVVAPRLRIAGRWVVLGLSLYVLLAALFNQRANGFTPLAAGYSFPTITAHDRLLDQALALIPPTASVSAQDQINPHVSDRGHVYLFPDTDGLKADFVVLDMTQPVGSTDRPCDVANQIAGNAASCALAAAPGAPLVPWPQPLLDSTRYNVVFAQDGIVVFQRRAPNQPWKHTLSAQFFSFMHPAAGQAPPHPLVARFGPYLELDGYAVERRETTNLRNPDVVLTTWWRVLKPMPTNARLIHYLTDTTGALQVFSADQQATDWEPLATWKAGQVYTVRSSQLTVMTQHSGTFDVDLGLSLTGANFVDPSYNIPVQVLSADGAALPVAGGKILRVTRLRAQL